MYRVVAAAKAKAIEGSNGAASDGEKEAHELLRTLVRIIVICVVVVVYMGFVIT